MLDIYVKSFSQLTTEELYELLRLRSEVFVVEQNCVYQDIDGKDRKALHLIGQKNGEIVGYTRLFGKGNYFEMASIGRVVVRESERRFGYGHDIMKASVAAIKEHFGEEKIMISAQEYLISFYETHGFRQTGEAYLEDGIPHVKMVRK